MKQFSLILNYIAFKYLSDKPIDWRLFLAIAIPAGLTFGGTFNTARMYPDNWFMWQIYNLTKFDLQTENFDFVNSEVFQFTYFL